VKKTRGFTLIELLVSMMLLSMVTLIGSSAFGLFGQSWDGRLGRFDSTMSRAKNVMLVQDVLDSLVPYVAFDRDGKGFMYFEGNRNGFVAVSSKSLFSSGNFAVIRFSVKQNLDLTFDVFYEEWAMDRQLLTSVGEALAFSRPLLLFASVSTPVFEYYGWSDARDRPSERGGKPEQWHADYDGLRAIFAPKRARLTFTLPDGTYTISSTLANQRKGLLSRYNTGEDV
jgi:prepilin-type N-terminal cleavage/methylation domain-containing protein